MPTYLIHGFRWPRPLIRIHIILQNIDDAAAEWLMAPATTNSLVENFRKLHGETMAHLPDLRFIEQYDPSDESADAKSQPYAYVADVVHEVRLGVEVDDIRGKGVSNETWGAIVDLRDAIAPGEKVAWFVVVCGDIERWVPPTVKLLENSGAYYRGQHDMIMEPVAMHGTEEAGEIIKGRSLKLTIVYRRRSPNLPNSSEATERARELFVDHKGECHFPPTLYMI